MVILVHIIIALVSIIYSGFVLISPSKTKINISYALIAGTFVSGTYLILIMPAHMIQACLEGLGYLAIVSIATIFSYKKLAAQEITE